jgi:hypothetical protein
MPTTLDSQKVNEIFRECLYNQTKDTGEYIEAEGPINTAAFHPDRLNKYKGEIEAMLAELPDAFNKSTGGGMSFICALEDKHGNQWTGLHTDMQQLFQLGIGIGKVECLLPRNMWSAFPDGMPYYVIN